MTRRSMIRYDTIKFMLEVIWERSIAINAFANQVYRSMMRWIQRRRDQVLWDLISHASFWGSYSVHNGNSVRIVEEIPKSSDWSELRTNERTIRKSSPISPSNITHGIYHLHRVDRGWVNVLILITGQGSTNSGEDIWLIFWQHSAGCCWESAVVCRTQEEPRDYRLCN